MTPNKHLHTINLICSWSQRLSTQDAVQMFLLYVRMFASNPHQRRIPLTGWCIWLFIVAVLKEKESLVLERLGKTAFMYHFVSCINLLSSTWDFTLSRPKMTPCYLKPAICQELDVLSHAAGLFERSSDGATSRNRQNASC